MKRVLFSILLILAGSINSQAQLITFDGFGYVDLQALPSPYSIANGSETFIFTLSNGGAPIAGDHRYRTTDMEGCGNTGLNYLRVDQNASHWTIETSSGNEINLGNVRLLNMYDCAMYGNYNYPLTITGYKNNVAVGSQAVSVTGGVFTFVPNASFDDVDKIVITGSIAGAVAGLGIDDINWGPPIVACTNPTTPTITSSPATICSGSALSLTISGTLNDATHWAVYTGSCGGTLVGTTTTSTFVAPAISSNTTYYVRGEGGCVVPGSCGTITVNTTLLDNASFNYSAAAYCSNDSDPTPTITGVAGGTFTSGAGLSINSSTGKIDVSASTPATYTVTYTTAGACPNSSNVSVTINALDNASFSYGITNYCPGAPNGSPTITGLSGGTFTSSPAGLSINSSTGEIQVNSSMIGPYTVTYTTNGACPNSSNMMISISGSPLAPNPVTPVNVCAGSNVVLQATGSGFGDILYYDNSLALMGSVAMPPASTSLNIGTLSTGSYIFNAVEQFSGGCPSPPANIAVNVLAIANAGFNYSAASYCANASDPSPTITGETGGTFSSTAGLSINASTGTLDVSASTPGTYTVTYTTSGACTNSSAVSVTINALDNAGFNYGAATYCSNGSDPTPTISGLAGGTFTSGAGLSISASTGLIDVSATTPGTYTITYTTTGTCVNSSSISVNIGDNIPPTADLVILATVTDECSVTNLTAPTATDNCAGSITGTHNVTLPITAQGTTVVTWTYDDGNGNTSTQTQNVVITDVTAPVADVATLSNVTAECSVTSLSVPTATDNCAGTITGTHNATLPITAQGTTVVTWTYADGNGNTSTQTQNVIITDFTVPVADIASLSNVTSECSVTSLTSPTATDNCAGTITGTHDATLPITSQGTTVVTWTYDDGNGNAFSQTQNVIITDFTVPVADITSLSNVTSECSVTSLTSPTATDNCAGTITGTHNAILPITAQGTTVVTWTYDDGNGNTSTQTQNVVITDVTAPVANVASLSNVTSECSVTSLTAPTATDNCAGSITGTHNATLPITAQGTTVVTWTYDDGNGNTSTQTQDILIDDVTAPEPFIPILSDITSSCPVSNIPDQIAFDNCFNDLVAGTHDATLPITAQGTTVVTWTYSDVNGNAVTQTQNVIITPIDNGVTQVDDVTLSADASGYSYQWVDCDNGNQAINGATSQTFVATVNGNYAVEIDNGTCSVMSSCILISEVGIEEIWDTELVEVYPNPTENTVTISSSAEFNKIEVLNALGQKVGNYAVSKTTTYSLTLPEENGVYFIQIYNNESSVFKRVIKR